MRFRGQVKAAVKERLQRRVFEAIKVGRPDVLRGQISLGAKLNFWDKRSGETPLILAAKLGSEEMVRLLLEGGAKPSSRCLSGLSALHHAAINGHARIVKALIEAGAKIDSRGYSLGATPLMAAAVGGQMEAAEALLEAGADPLAAGLGCIGFILGNPEGEIELESNGKTWKVSSGQIAAGGWTAHELCREPELKRVLCAAQAARRQASAGGAHRAKEAVRVVGAGLMSRLRLVGGHARFLCLGAKLALPSGGSDAPVEAALSRAMWWAACHEDHWESALAQALVEGHWGVSARDFLVLGATRLLEFATARDGQRMVRWLVQEAGGAEALGWQGEEALRMAAECGNTRCVQALLKAGASVNARDWYGQTALMRAGQMLRHYPPGVGRSVVGSVVEVLLRHGADPWIKDQEGRSAIDWVKAWPHAWRHADADAIAQLMDLAGQLAAEEERAALLAALPVARRVAAAASGGQSRKVRL